MQPHDFYMKVALGEAFKAYELGEVPVGAVIVSEQGEILSQAHNQTIQQSDPTGHAEIIVLRNASRVLKNYRLNKTRIYVTIEPCIMCVGALIHARVEEGIFGAYDPKWGGLSSLYKLGDDPRLNHRVKFTPGILKEECSEIIQCFFKEKR
ncbi:MAG: tRNA adenosine(34) deaminase TadA [Desulfobacterota bacterium]|nr:tRNA adenosine(34) deaminase TadA [Thermodesulfobacteriota bacterium]